MNVLNPYFAEVLAYVAVAALFGVPLILLNVKLAPRLGLIDWPKARGVTEEQIPIVGHSMVAIALVALCILATAHVVSPWVLITSFVMAIMGHLDDRRPLPPLDKFFFQIVCTAAVVYLDPGIRAAMTMKYGAWGTFLSAFFLVGLMNAVNFIDGIDGLAGIVLTVGALGYLFLAYGLPENYPYFVVASVIAGLQIPFLFVNVVKRRGFLGNVGSYFFSYLLGIMHLSLSVDCEGVFSRLSLAGLCFLVPIADAGTVVILRLFTSRSPFEPDRGHLHHRLVQSSLNLRHILLIFAMLEGSSLTVAFLMSAQHSIRNSWVPVFVCVSNVFITSCLILLVEKASRRRLQTYFERLDQGGPIYFLRYHIRNTDGSPVTVRKLYRLEARVGAEIRISDVCFAEKPDKLFITLKVLHEPLKGISARLEAILTSEKVEIVGIPEFGEYLKIIRHESVNKPARRA